MSAVTAPFLLALDRIVPLAAMTGFFVSVIVHFATFLHLEFLADFPAVFILHLGAMGGVLFIIAADKGWLGDPRSWTDEWESIPGWVFALGGVVFVYAGINFALFIAQLEGGMPTVDQGRYLLLDHAKLIKEPTYDEYVSLKLRQIRGFSGHWMLFYLLPFAYFTYRKEVVDHRLDPLQVTK